MNRDAPAPPGTVSSSASDAGSGRAAAPVPDRSDPGRGDCVASDPDPAGGAPAGSALAEHAPSGTVLLYHASRSSMPIVQFAAFSHFGTARAALERSASAAFARAPSVTVYEVEIELAQPLRIDDLEHDARPNNHGIATFTDYLHYERGILSAAERETVLEAASPSCSNAEAGFEALARILAARGADGFVYANAFEDKGQDSVIILHPGQARIVRAVPREVFEEEFAQAHRARRARKNTL